MPVPVMIAPERDAHPRPATRGPAPATRRRMPGATTVAAQAARMSAGDMVPSSDVRRIGFASGSARSWRPGMGRVSTPSAIASQSAPV
jgi:hypothetical protein